MIKVPDSVPDRAHLRTREARHHRRYTEYFSGSEVVFRQAAGVTLPTFVYTSKGLGSFLKYYRAPESVFEDSEQMMLWSD